jgi:hypothetical protein
MILFLLWIPTVAWGRLSERNLFLSFPLQRQYPLIATPGSAYQWCFSPNTFDMRDENGDRQESFDASYSANNLPSWTHFDSLTRCFSGNVPTSATQSSTTVTVVASSGTHNSSDEFRLVTTTDPEPLLAVPLAVQLVATNSAISSAFVVNPSSALAPFYSNPTALGDKAGLRVPPLWSFSIGLLGSMFASASPLYLATLSNGTTLPTWIRYDQGSFTFDGIAPRHSEALEIKLTATDVEGYSTNTADTFWLTVAAHELKLKDATRGLSRNVTAVATDFDLYLLDGEDDDPFGGELLWDWKPLPRAGVYKVNLVSRRLYGEPIIIDCPYRTLRTLLSPLTRPRRPYQDIYQIRERSIQFYLFL